MPTRIYARISRDENRTRLGVDRQVRMCRAEAVKRGLSDPIVYVESDTSANHRKPRPVYQRLIAGVITDSEPTTLPL